MLSTVAFVLLCAFGLHSQQARAVPLDDTTASSAAALSSSVLSWDTSTEDSTTAVNTGNGKRNLIFMVSDGMGSTSVNMARSFQQLALSAPYNNTLFLDSHLTGTSRTRSSWSLVTDSAAGATAFSCGKKSYNGAIAMTPEFEPCGTVLEAAKRAGYLTGLVVTTDVTDATPACFASHAYYRAMMDDIALQEVGNGTLGRVVDLILGGGRCHFLPNSTDANSTTAGPSCRADDVDVIALARAKFGWSYVDDRAGFDALAGGDNVELPLLGLFASQDFPFALDRRVTANVSLPPHASAADAPAVAKFPSLVEMAATAARALEKAALADPDAKGFFLMVEGSRIDHAGHLNDPAAQVWETLEFDATFKSMAEFLDASESEGALVSTSDHETGGLATAWRKFCYFCVSF